MDETGTLFVMLIGLQLTPHNSKLHLHVDTPFVRSMLMKKWQFWEDMGYVGLQDPELVCAVISHL